MLLDGLTSLEYRGYDSAGIALLSQGEVLRHRSVGKVQNLRDTLPSQLQSNIAHIGMAHSRWAVVGAVTEANAHPQSDGTTVVVHNGIIENAHELAQQVPEAQWESQTDTEVVVHLISKCVREGDDLLEATDKVVRMLTGTFALVIMHTKFPNMLVAAKQVNPLSVGMNQDGDLFFASDIMATSMTRYVDLEEKNICVIEKRNDGAEALRCNDGCEALRCNGGAESLRCNGGAESFKSNGGAESFDVSFYDFAGDSLRKIDKTWQINRTQALCASKEHYPNFTIKEINEQPHVIQNSIDALNRGAHINVAQCILDASAVNIVACGSSFYAGLVGKYWIERLLGILTNVDISSEFYYRDPVILDNSLNIFISQSGETLDTLRAMEYCRARSDTNATVFPARTEGFRSKSRVAVELSDGLRNESRSAVELTEGLQNESRTSTVPTEESQNKSIVLTNVLHSAMARAIPLEHLVDLGAGPERSVISTKAFTAQLAALIGIVIQGLRLRCSELVPRLEQDFARVPELLRHVIGIDFALPMLLDASSVLYLGRGACYPIAMEGALKLKESAYLYAEGYPAGEMKHGPIALIDERSVSIILAPYNELFDKMASNVHEVLARGGRVVLVTDEIGAAKFKGESGVVCVVVPTSGDVSCAFVYSIVAQMLAYNTARSLGRDLDRPRNLAKAVTVE
jgi:glucosamine--fructose-6-phosphate aminotransferase (isomerizing)